MSDIRRAFLFASAGKYVMMVTGIVTTAVVARHLTPAEFGLTVLGGSVFGIADAVRELASPSYLIQQRELTLEKIQTSFTVSLITTLVVAAAVMGVAVPAARLYDMPMLEYYIYVMVAGYATGPLVYPIFGLLSRDMAFHKIAALDIASSLTNAAATIGLLVAGIGFMSLAWATVASSLTAVGFALVMWRDFRIFRVTLRDWRGVLSFGLFGSTTALLASTSEALFYLIAGRMLNPGAIGLLQRALLLANLPERMILAGLNSVALPSFSRHARAGHDLKAAYFGAIEYITGIEWPALVCLIVLAEPISLILLGPRWTEVVPLMSVVSAALMVNFPGLLNYPLQVATGGVRQITVLTVINVTLALTVKIYAAQYGIHAVAVAVAAMVPVQAALSLTVLRMGMPFGVRDIATAVWKSATSAGLCAVLMLLAIDLAGWQSHIPASAAIATAALGGVGWLAGLWLTGHPLLRELAGAANELSKLAKARRVANARQ